MPWWAAWLIDHVMEVKQDVSHIKARLGDGDHRMTRIEAQQKHPNRWRLLVDVAKEAGTAREWIIAISLAVFWIKGMLSAAEIKALLLHVLGS